VTVRFSARARREASRIDERWRIHAEHRQLFVEELATAIEQIRHEPKIGTPYDAATRHAVRRVRLPKTDYFVYYTADAGGAFVVAVWSARRGRQPRL
jgi:plasmid stabilization system protein ParE